MINEYKEDDSVDTSFSHIKSSKSKAHKSMIGTRPIENPFQRY